MRWAVRLGAWLLTALYPSEPRCFRRERQHLAEDVDDADDEHAHDDAVEHRVGHEGVDQRRAECRTNACDEHQKDAHAYQEGALLVHLRVRGGVLLALLEDDIDTLARAVFRAVAEGANVDTGTAQSLVDKKRSHGERPRKR